jgi:hypothetical protein
MKIHLKLLQALPFFLLIISCNQKDKNKNLSAIDPSILKKRDSIYSVMSYEICDSFLNKKDSSKSYISLLNNCCSISINKHHSELMNLGIDSGTSAAKPNLENDVVKKVEFTCPDVFALVAKECNEEEYKNNKGKLFFTGSLVSQTKLSSGRFEILIKDNKTSETRIFYSEDSIDETTIRKYEPGYSITVDYLITKNRITHKKEFILRKGAGISSVGAVKVENP